MNIWEALFLGFVQGATEFLPVSSSGHLVAGQALLGLKIPGVRFEVAVHLATLISVFVIYRVRLRTLLDGIIRRDGEILRYLGLLLLATVPAGLLGVLFGNTVKSLFENPFVPATAFLVTGLILWSTRWAHREESLKRPDVRGAILIGLAQAFAMVPGISRSGTTVAMALWLGIAPKEAAAFSFLMSIPTIGGAALLQLSDVSSGDLSLSTTSIVAGSVVAAITGMGAIRAFVLVLARQTFHHFGVYCWVLGVVFLAYLLVSVG